MTCSALDGAAWNAVKSEQSGSEITYYFPVKAGRKTIMGGGPEISSERQYKNKIYNALFMRGIFFIILCISKPN